MLGTGDRLTVTLKADGTYSAPWIVVKADTIQELGDLVESVESSGLGAHVAQAAKAFEGHYAAGKTLGATPVTPVQAYQPASGAQQPAQQPPAGYGQSQPHQPAQQPGGATQPPPGVQVPTCPHGTKTYKEGAKNGRTWRAFMCPAPKNEPSQCPPEWLKG